MVVLASLVLTACSTAAPQATGSARTTASTGAPVLVDGPFVPQVLPAPLGALRAISCVSVDRCWAAASTVGLSGSPNGAAIVRSTGDQLSWSNQAIPTTTDYLSDLDCWSADDCVAVGQAGPVGGTGGAFLATANGGKTWVADPAPTGVTDVDAVSCASTGRCLAVGQGTGGLVALAASGAGSGASWSQVGTLPATLTGAYGVSCAGTSVCVAVGTASTALGKTAGAGAISTDQGATWSAITLPAGVGALDAVDCRPATGTSSSGSGSSGDAARSTTCAAVGTSATTVGSPRAGSAVLLTSDDGGTTWATTGLDSRLAGLTAVSCADGGPCVAVGTTVSGQARAGAVVLAGTGPTGAAVWSRATTVLVPQSLDAASCLPSGGCVLGGESITGRLTPTG